MDPRLIAQLVAGGRVVVGLALMASPPLITRRWVGDAESEHVGTRVMATGLGVRDVVVGAGTLAAVRAGGDASRAWLIGSMAADLGDLYATLRHARDLPTPAVSSAVAVAGGATAAGAWLLGQDLG